MCLSHLFQRTLNHLLTALWASIKAKKNPKLPKAATFHLALFKMAKITLQQPKFLYVTTPPNKLILLIPRNTEYAIWVPWVTKQIPETTKYTLNAVAFSLVWLWTVKIMLQVPQFIPIPTSPHMSYLTHSKRPWVTYLGFQRPSSMLRNNSN